MQSALARELHQLAPMKRSLICLAIVASVATARADEVDDKSPGIALGLSLGGTIASGVVLGLAIANQPPSQPVIVAGAVGLALLPSAGHWYAHDYLSTGLLLRAGAVAGAAVLYGVLPCHRGDSPYEPCTSPGAQGVALGLGAAAFGIGVLWDIGSAPGAAERYNDKHSLSANLVPVVTRSGYGLALAGRF